MMTMKRLWLVAVLTLCVGATASAYDLTVVPNGHGMVGFSVGGTTVTTAEAGQVVAITVTPDEGYTTKSVTARAYTTWEAAARGVRHAPQLLYTVNVTASETEGTWTFTMPDADVQVEVEYYADAEETVILADGDTYTRTLDMTVASATYVKSIAEERVGLHQAWFVPFDYTLTSDDMNAFWFYKINMIANAPNPETEASDEIWVFLKRMNEDEVLHANMPYVYRAKRAVENYEFTTSNAMLKGKNTGVLATMQTMEETYTLYGTYEGTTATAEDPFYYVNIEGDLSLGNDGTVTVGAYRWIMRVESKFGSTPANARTMHFFDGEETTGIKAIDNGQLTIDNDRYYDLQGRRIEQPKKGGLYIIRSAEGRLQGKNGRKVVIRSATQGDACQSKK